MLSQNQTAKNQKKSKVCNNQNQSQNPNYLIKKKLFVVYTLDRVFFYFFIKFQFYIFNITALEMS